MNPLKCCTASDVCTFFLVSIHDNLIITVEITRLRVYIGVVGYRIRYVSAIDRRRDTPFDHAL